MNAAETAAVRRWLRENRASVPGKDGSPEITQEDLAKAITAATDWKITRDRYSKYESGPLPIGRVVLGHFVKYWAMQGKPAPDFTPPKDEAPEDPVAAAIDRQTVAIGKLTDQIEALLASRDKDLVALASAVGKALQGRVNLDRTPAA